MQNEHQKVAVIGGGSWATAIVKLLLQTHQEVYWWVRDEAQVAHIQNFGHNPKYLTSAQVKLPKEHVSTDLHYIISQATWVVMAVPAAFLPLALADILPEELEGKIIVSAIKVCFK